MVLANTAHIDLWFWHLAASPATVARWHTYLDARERERMARFVFARDQTRFTICRSRLRRILGWYTANNPRDIRFASSGHGKPVLAEPNPRDVHFSLSHTQGLACLAVSHRDAVGVDLERLRDIKDNFVAYALNPAEYAPVLALKADQKQAAFFRFWTAKEAYLKSIGTGLGQSLKTFDVSVPLDGCVGSFAAGALTRIDDDNQCARDWRLYSFRATPHHIGALAVKPPSGAEVEIRPRWIDDADTEPDQ